MENFGVKECSHIIHRNKYERNAPEITNWWHKLFDMLESEAAIVSLKVKFLRAFLVITPFQPPDRRLDVVNEIFPGKLLNRILSILSFIKTCKKGTTDDGELLEKGLDEQKTSASLLTSISEEGPNR